MGGTERETATGICVDPAGNMYTTGYFRIRGDFDPTNGTHTLPVVSEPNANSDAYVVKTTTSGKFLWAGKIGGRQTTRSTSLATDDSGNVYVAGFFASGRIDCDPGPDTFWLNPAGSSNNAFLCKLDSSGNFLWAKVFGSSNVIANDVAVDHGGNVYLAGLFSGRTDFNPGADSFFLTKLSGTSGFVCKLRHDGEFIRAMDVGGTVTAIGLDQSAGICLTGVFNGKRDLDPSTDSAIVNATGSSQDIYLSQLDSSGSFNWGLSFGGDYLDNSTALSVDASGNILVTGIYAGLVDFDPGPGIDTFSTPPATAWSATWISKFNTNGVRQWSKNLKGNDYVWAADITCNQANNIFITGYFQKTADFDPGAGSQPMTVTGGPSSVHPDVFICKLDPNGDYSWAFKLGGTSTDEGTAIAVDQQIGIYSTGGYLGTVDFHPGIFKAEETSTGTNYGDIYLQKIKDCVSSMHSITVTSCGAYEAPDGNRYSASGTYQAVLQNALGCDSIIAIGLTVINVEVSIITADLLLTADYDGANSYTWVYCDSNYKPVPGASLHDLTVQQTGNYAVIVEDSCGSDTSDCVFVDLTSVQPVLSDAGIRVFPNPTQGKLNVYLPESWNTPCVVDVYDATGRLVARKMQFDTRIFDLTVEAPPGLYWMKITSATRQVILPVTIRP